jgi:hypothetical protein
VQTVNGLIAARTDRQLQALQTGELRLLLNADESRFNTFHATAMLVADGLRVEEGDASLHVKLLGMTRDAIEQSVRIVSEVFWGLALDLGRFYPPHPCRGVPKDIAC